ncbi:MAG TPA: DEAD/DEAH box helicase [Methanoregulaceae archaeon]|jgi:hypothetical protein|nr:DEAD/DEAH box helicase [Methanoregulaceae archaeon]
METEITVGCESEELSGFEPQENHDSGDYSLKEFLNQYGDILKDKIKSEMKPLFDPGNYDVVDKARAERFREIVRKKRHLLGQEKAVLALLKGYNEGGKRGLILCAEMGTGKTLMGLAVAYLLGAKRVLVMCPGHLVRKWMREARELFPDARLVNLNGRGMEDLFDLKTGVVKPVSLWDTGKPSFEVWVIGKDRAKLHYKRERSYRTKKVRRYGGIFECPRCANILDGYLEDLPKNRKPFCPQCNEPLYQPDDSYRRYAKAEYIKRYLKGAFDFFIADEVHELKGGTTGQGQSFANLASACKRTLALTGTLMGGYSSNLFYLLWRLMPREMVDQSMQFGSEMMFAGRYGIIERVYKSEDDYNTIVIGGRKGKLVRASEKPGISPILLTDFLLPYTVFMRLSDVSDALPPYEEKVMQVDMEPIQKEEYKKFEDALMVEVREAIARGDRRLLGKMLQSLLGYPDGCTTRGEMVMLQEGDTPVLIASAPLLENIELPKMQTMIDYLKLEISQGRKCLVCLEHTGERDLVPGLVEHIERAGMKTPLVLRSDTVKAEKREEWLMQKAKDEDFDILITNPKLVQTGLDLMDYPSIMFYQTGYSIFTLRQASRRSYRIGQDKPVRVMFLSYRGTAQEKAIKLIASKLETALAVEGDLTDKGLTALASSESSMLFALARELISGGDGRSVEEVWLDYTKRQSKVDSLVTERQDDEVTTVTVTTSMQHGNHQTSVSYTRVFRAKVYPTVLEGRKVGLVRLKNSQRMIFAENKIWWGETLVGTYEGHEGQLLGRPIELIRQKENEFYLYELRQQETPTV